MANKMLDRIKISVGGNYKKKHMNIFKKEVTAGKRITYTELKNLQGDYKEIYKTVIKEKDKEINAYMSKAIKKADDTKDDVYQQISEMQDMRDSVDLAER